MTKTVLSIPYNPTGELFNLTVDHDMLVKLATHGAKQKCNDAHASEKDKTSVKAAEKFAAVLEALRAGTWSESRAAHSPMERRALEKIEAWCRSKGHKGKELAKQIEIVAANDAMYKQFLDLAKVSLDAEAAELKAINIQMDLK